MINNEEILAQVKALIEAGKTDEAVELVSRTYEGLEVPAEIVEILPKKEAEAAEKADA